ncbi:MAG TPA: type II/IV secretion system ATPase subunit [Candidatus Thermoplasmatota archaeon]|nr:type II/IV secretion system ATPase subunit [Candidatus Thermoplasmatota archaeon]
MSAVLGAAAVLERHIARHAARTGRRPQVLAAASDLRSGAEDVTYPIGDGVWAHLHREGGLRRYHLVEPELAPEQAEEVVRLRERMATEAARQGDRERKGTLREALLAILRRMRPGADPRTDPVANRLLQDMAGYGPVDALLRDPHLEDIHVVGTNAVYVIHSLHGMMPTNVRFADELDLVRFLRLLCERLGRPVSDSTPIVDAVLPDGSRLNLVYSEDVSRRGPSLSLRRGNDAPFSITRLVQLNTLTAEAAAYLWICLQQGMSMFLCGEAACGKTSTLNAMLPFIDPRGKIYSAEDTPEVRPPHRIWQRLLTRETGPPDGHVRMFDLLRAALRSRPDYIVVGEIRGAEGAVAFQAMQTGHATLATFHATDATTLVQRLGAPPISVPLTFIDNLNVALFQESRVVDGRRVRRVTRLVEIASSTPEGVVAIPVFAYDLEADNLRFQGLNNSHILEKKIAPLLGMDDTRKIYDVLARRTRIVEEMVRRNIVEAGEVARIFMEFSVHGEKSLPFRLEDA